MPLPNPLALCVSALPPSTYEAQMVTLTGDGTGLGKSMALELARLGGRIAILCRKPVHLTAGLDKDANNRGAKFAARKAD